MSEELHSQAGAYCDRCGRPLVGGAHPACTAARDLEPARYCPQCSRRMVVQVTPSGWSATCSEHGTIGGGTAGG